MQGLLRRHRSHYARGGHESYEGKGSLSSFQTGEAPCAEALATKSDVPVLCVRHGILFAKNRGHRERWGQSIQNLTSLKSRRLIEHLQKDRILGRWEGHQCAPGVTGTIGALKHVKVKKVWAYRCNYDPWHKFLQPHDRHIYDNLDVTRANYVVQREEQTHTVGTGRT